MTKLIQDFQLAMFKAGFVALSGFSTAGGVSDNVSTPLAELLANATRQSTALPLQAAVLTSGSEAEGVVTSVPYNKIILRDVNDKHIQDGSGNDVFGRISVSGAVWTVSYFSLIAGAETAYSMPASTVLTMLIPCIFSLYHYPYPSDLVVLDLSVDSETSLVGKRPFTASLPVTIANTLPPLPQPSIGAVMLAVNGVIYCSLDTNPAFTVSGNTVTWNSANSFTLQPGSNVIALGYY